MARSFRRQVTFSETDASGRVHFAVLLKWMEEAEHQWLAEKGVPVFFPEGGWPRVNVQCDYRLPLAFEDEVEIVPTLAEVGQKSLRWTFLVLKAGKEVAAEGTMTTVYVEGGRAAEIPRSLRSQLEC